MMPYRPKPHRTPTLKPPKYLRRGSASQRGYGVVWRRLRLMQLAREPLCRDCRRRGLLTPGEHVDHIVPKRDGGEDLFDNLQTLCETCHARKTVLQDGGFGRAKRGHHNVNGNGSFDEDGSEAS